jgi:glutamyl-tRNA synthetase
MSLVDLAARFHPDRLGRVPSQYDSAQLLHWQREAVIHGEAPMLWQWMGEDVHRLVPQIHREAFLEAVRHNVLFPKDAVHWAKILFSDPLKLNNDAQAIINTAGSQFFAQAAKLLEAYPHDFSAFVKQLKNTTGVKGKALFLPLRAALTGESDGPEMTHLIPLLSVERARQRLQESTKYAG